MKTITLKKVDYYISGIADVTPWGGGVACIGMKHFTTKTKSKKEIKPLLNDNGFGVQSLNGAICDIYELYENDYKVYLTNLFNL